MSAHLKTFYDSVRLIDMANAGKRGKTCRVLTIYGAGAIGVTGHPASAWCRVNAARVAGPGHEDTAGRMGALVPGDFETLAAALRAGAAQWPDVLTVREETIRGIDAPRPLLTAGVEGMWSGAVNESGVSLADLTDRANDPRIVTARDQSPARAYVLAAKAWPRVQAALTFSEAWTTLSTAGCSLHYFCAID